MSVVRVLPMPKYRAAWLGEVIIGVNGSRDPEEDSWRPHSVQILVQFLPDPEAEFSELVEGKWQLVHVLEEPYLIELHVSGRGTRLSDELICQSQADLAALTGDVELARELSAAARDLLGRWDDEGATTGSMAAYCLFEDMSAFNDMILRLTEYAARNSGARFSRTEQLANIWNYWSVLSLIQFTRFAERRPSISPDELDDFDREVDAFRRLRQAGIDAATRVAS